MKYRVYLAALLFSSLLGGCVFSSASQTENPKIAVITQSDKEYFWQVMFAGAKSAGVEYGLEVDLFAPAIEDSYRQQITLIEKVVRDGYDALLFASCDYNATVAAVEAAMDAGVQVVTIDSGIASGRGISFIGSDNLAAGYAAGKILGSFTQNTANVAIVGTGKFAASSIQRNQGVLEYLEQTPGMQPQVGSFSPSNREAPYQAILAILEQNPEIGAIVALNEWSALGVGQAIDELELGEKLPVVAFDNNEESVQMLEKGVIDALIVQNPFAMGYLGVEQALAQLAGKTVEETTVYTETVVVTVDNMFTAQNQKLLFPFTP